MMFILINGPKDATKFNGIPYAIYWFQVKHIKLVDDPIGFTEKNEYEFDFKKRSLYFKDSELF